MKLDFVFSKDVFGEPTGERFASHFVQLALSVLGTVDEHGKPTSDLEILTDEERNILTNVWPQRYE